MLVFFLPEKLLKYVVRDPITDGGTRYRPATPFCRGAGFFFDTGASVAGYGESYDAPNYRGLSAQRCGHRRRERRYP